MNRSTSILLALFAILTVASTASAASWLHAGYDPARTGAIPFQGPATDDVALKLQLPGAVAGTPLIHNGSAYVLTEARPALQEDLTENALWRLDLATGATEKVMDVQGSNATLAPTLDMVVSEANDAVVAQAVPSGEELWHQPAPGQACPGEKVSLGATVFDGGRAYLPLSLACTDQGSPEEVTTGLEEPTRQHTSIVWSVNVTSGNLTGSWWRPAAVTSNAGQGAQIPVDGPTTPVLSVSNGRVLASIIVVNDTGVEELPGVGGTSETATQEVQHEVWALRTNPSESTWRQAGPAREMSSVAGTDSGGELQQVDAWIPTDRGGGAVVGEGLVFIRLDQIEARNLASGELVWEGGGGEGDQVERIGALSMGLRGETLIATSPQTAYRFDARTGEIGWQQLIEDPALVHGVEPMAVSDEMAYIPFYHPAPEAADIPMGYGISARSILDGELAWTWRDRPDVGPTDRMLSQPAFGEGFFLWGGPDGVVHVVGETDASPEPVVDIESTYPGPGETVHVDLSSSEPGAQGPVRFYGADWGDGTGLDEGEDPVLSHTYEQEGEVTARFVVGNEAGQTASTFVTFHVGGSEPNMIETAFARENQDMTFGILGILVAVTGGAIGVARSYRKRTRLQDVLAGIEEAYEETQHNPAECEAQLTERKTHARGLLLDGELREEQLQVVDNRIQELRTQLRMGTLEEGFKDLPHRVVRALEEMLKDGRITRMEHQGAHAAIDEAEGLTDTYKQRLREQIDAWHNRDARGHGAR